VIPAVQILHTLALGFVCLSIGGTIGAKEPPGFRLCAAACLIGALVCAAFGRPYP
jgi:hypothetical protein